MPRQPSSLLYYFSLALALASGTAALGQAAAVTNPSSNSGLSVYDSKGIYVGRALERNLVAQQINGGWVSFPVGYLGLRAEGLSLYFTSPNCTGTAYLAANDLPIRGVIYTEPGIGSFEASGFYANAGTLVYPTPPYSLLTMSSVLGVQTLTSASGMSGSCAPLESKANVLAGPAGTIKIGPFKPPFTSR